MMIANISPCLSCSEHTLNTLRYADRVKELRKERNDKDFIAKEDKDPSEVLAQMLMMPRQHTKTVKYNFEVKKNVGIQIDKDNKIISGNGQNNNQGGKGPLHINQLINNKNVVLQNNNKNSASNENSNKNNNENNQRNNGNHYGSQKSYDDNMIPTSNNYLNMNYNIKENQRGVRHNSAKSPNPNNFYVNELNKLENNNNNGIYNNNGKNQVKNNVQSNNQANNNLNIVNLNNNLNNLNLNQNNLEGEIDFEKYVSKYTYSVIRSEDEFHKLSNEHEKLINNILQEEEEFIQLHKNHIDDVVDLVKQVNFLSIILPSLNFRFYYIIIKIRK